jgi:hypothetical protein
MPPHQRPAKNRSELGFDPSTIGDLGVRQALSVADQNIKELYKRTQQGASQAEESFDHQPGNNNEFDRIWHRIRKLEDRGGSGGGGGSSSIPTVYELPEISTAKIVFLDSSTAGNRQKWGSNPEDDRWYPMEKLTSGDGAVGMT